MALPPSPRLPRLAALAFSLAAPALALAVLLLGLPAPAQAANIVVTTCTPAGLRAAIAAAGSSGLVTFNCPGGAHTFVLTQTQVISRDITIDGGSVITLSGGDAIRLFSVPSAEKATLLNLTLAHGNATQGSALNVAGLAVITNVTFVQNSSTFQGGALNVTNLGTADISRSRFEDNTSSDNGGAISTAGGLSADQSRFSSNVARVGGAIAQLDSTPAVIANSTFVLNRSEFGGAIISIGRLTLAGDEFDHNSTPLAFPVLGIPGGGALFLSPGAQAVVRETVFFSNTADVGGTDGVGGAIANEGSLIVLDSLFNQNHALDDGGAVFNDASLALTQTTFIRNSSLANGGAISNTGALTLTASTLVTNTAGQSGGAIANVKSFLADSSLLFNNVAAQAGGGVRNYAGGRLTFVNSTFYSNTAVAGAGGAVLNSNQAIILNSTLAANHAGGSGGALVNVGPTTDQAVLKSDTIVSNTAASAGAALRGVNGMIILGNSLVGFNSPANCQGTITDQGHNLQFGGLSCGAGITSTNLLLGPLQDNGGTRVGVFDVGLPTLLPQAGSPAINAGLNSQCGATDERGLARLAPCDIGAVERVFPIALPLLAK